MKLIEIRILKVEFHLNKDYTGKSETVSFTPDIALRYNFIKETNILAVIVGLRQKSGNVPYFFEVEGGGLFKFENLPEANTIEIFSTINCPAIVFPYIRETIADITRRAGFPALHINPINFIELSKQRKKEPVENKPASQ